MQHAMLPIQYECQTHNTDTASVRVSPAPRSEAVVLSRCTAGETHTAAMRGSSMRAETERMRYVRDVLSLDVEGREGPR